MTDYLDRWDKEGEGWKKIFRAIDPVLHAFATNHHLTIKPYRWDSPDRVLSLTGTVGKTLRVCIDRTSNRYTLSIGGAAWYDAEKERRRTRRLARKMFEGLAIPGKLEDPAIQRELKATLLDRLEGAFKEISSWQTDRLKEEVEIG